jgi:hypothetical protein
MINVLKKRIKKIQTYLVDMCPENASMLLGYRLLSKFSICRLLSIYNDISAMHEPQKNDIENLAHVADEIRRRPVDASLKFYDSLEEPNRETYFREFLQPILEAGECKIKTLGL